MSQERLRTAFFSKGNFIDGKFSKGPDIDGEWICRSPADFSDEIARIPFCKSSIELAVGSSARAFKTWRKTTLAARTELLKKYQEALKKRESLFVEAISREIGKPLWESKAEHAAMLGKIDITINEGMSLVADSTIPLILPNTTGSCRYKPLGVMVVVGPFNFPGHLPNGHIVPALLTGNTVIFKPSEKAPIVGQLMAECFEEAGFPPGVFNLVQGDRELSRQLCLHEEVAGILFTGSYEVGTRLKQDTLQQHWKLLALEMGGKNAAIVWNDCDLEVALQEVLVSAFITTGQRCSATSRVIVHQSLIDEFVTKLHDRAKEFSIGHPFDLPFMGPLIEPGAVDRYMKFIGISSREGGELVMRGKMLDLETKGNYVTPTLSWVKDSSIEHAQKSVSQQTELFAPLLTVLSSNDLDHAIALANATQFGLVASLFSADRANYERCFEDLEVGLVNWNRGTIGASSRLPFGGIKKSGNHFPTALSATRYCTAPISALEVEKPVLAGPGVYPGLT